MGGLSIWHGIIVLIFLAVAVVAVSILVWLFARFSRTRTSQRASIRGASIQPASESPGSESPGPATVESRLLHLDDLWAKGVITELEYEQQRSAIIKRIQ